MQRFFLSRGERKRSGSASQAVAVAGGYAWTGFLVGSAAVPTS